MFDADLAYICWNDCKVPRSELLSLLAVLAEYGSSATNCIYNGVYIRHERVFDRCDQR